MLYTSLKSLDPYHINSYYLTEITVSLYLFVIAVFSHLAAIVWILADCIQWNIAFAVKDFLSSQCPAQKFPAHWDHRFLKN